MSYKKIEVPAQKELVETIQSLKMTSIRGVCEVIRLNCRRYYRWQHMRAPVTRAAWNRITPQEEVTIVEVGSDEWLSDF